METRAPILHTITKSRDKQGNLRINQYTIFKSIGEGGYAVVKHAKYNENNYVPFT